MRMIVSDGPHSAVNSIATARQTRAGLPLMYSGPNTRSSGTENPMTIR